MAPFLQLSPALAIIGWWILSLATVAADDWPFNTRGVAFPDVRYTPWSLLDADQKSSAERLGYSEHTWNIPGTATVEEYSYDSVLLGMVPGIDAGETGIMQALQDLGFDDATVYDCYVNHYNGYSWSDLVELDAVRDESVLVDSLTTLGWTEEYWNAQPGSFPTPSSDYTAWEDLDLEEQQAARELCYLPETWQFMYASDLSGFLENDLESLWGTTYALMFEEGAAPVASGAVNATMSMTGRPPKPVNRFFTWESLPSGILDLVVSLGYDQSSWTRLFGADVEMLRFDNLSPAQLLAVTSLGFYPSTVYDCWIHHYETYSWDELQEGDASILSYWEDLGWNETSWRGRSPPPASSSTVFQKLSDIEQTAADQLCFTEEMWDRGMIPLLQLFADSKHSCHHHFRLTDRTATKLSNKARQPKLQTGIWALM